MALMSNDRAICRSASIFCRTDDRAANAHANTASNENRVSGALRLSVMRSMMAAPGALWQYRQGRHVCKSLWILGIRAASLLARYGTALLLPGSFRSRTSGVA